MNDQAEKLRQIVKKFHDNSNDNIIKHKKHNTKVFAITSGKGGVGKSNFTINLAISLTRLGYKVIVFDADIGFANIDVISGVIPKFTIADVINGNKSIVEIMTDGPLGVKIIAGGSGINDIMKLNNEKLELLTSQLLSLEDYADFILIDTSAGLSDASISFLNSSDEVILVTTPEPTSLTDGYAMIKTLVKNNPSINIKIVVNRANDSTQSIEVFNKLSKVTERFLRVDIENLGYLTDSKLVSESVMNQKPFILLFPNSTIAKKINNIALSLIGIEKNKESTGMKSFISSFTEFFNKRRK